MIQIVRDERPSAELTDIEIQAYLLREIRANNLGTANAVRQACREMFPDISPDREQAVLTDLANRLRP